MTTTTALAACLLCIVICAAAQKDAAAPLACNLKAISAAERPRYTALVKRLRAAILDRSELSNGYAFKLDGKAISLPEAAEWIGMERLCCPFLTFQLSTSGNRTDWALTLTGPAGVKALIDAEFSSK